MTAYYNEHDPYAAQWLRNLIAAGHIAPGEVDERSIVDVQPADLAGFVQCHFFAGIGAWSYALRRAGWADDRPVWTGSCPCQPFSAAGKGDEFADARHLWPAWFRLIRECCPIAVLGEQVASKDALTWLDHVSTDLESQAYTFGAVDTCSAGFGAPHIRQRFFWVAHAERERHDRSGSAGSAGSARQRWPDAAGRSESIERMADSASGGFGEFGRALEPGSLRHADGSGNASSGLAYTDGGHAGAEGLQRSGQHGQQQEDGSAGGLGNTERDIRQCQASPPNHRQSQSNGPADRASGCGGAHAEPESPGPVNGFWRDADWLFCTDGRWRPVRPGSFPLVNGAASRMGRLRAYGNGLNAEQARIFIESLTA